MQKPRRKYHRHILRGVLIGVGVFLLFTGVAYWWFIRNANSLLINLVEQRSHGTLALQLSHVSFNIFQRKVKIMKANIRNTDKAKDIITYNVSFESVNITTNSLWSAFLNRRLEVRNIKMLNPVIEVVNHAKKDTSSKDELALGLQLGKLYHSTDNALTSLNTQSIALENARIILRNAGDSVGQALEFSNIHFTLRRKERNSDQELAGNNVEFSSSNQDLTLSDGIHKLLFKKLTIQKGRNIVMDTCTIVALPKSSEGNSFNIHFKKLALVGVDFDALYRLNRIRADSVYCEKPAAYIYVNSALGERKKRKIPVAFNEPNRIMKDIAGDLDLGFVGVRDADLYFKIRENKTESNFTSGKVNFQISNLRVNPLAPVPVSVKSFDMLINGYQLYNADSSCVYTFDSIRFANDKLLLNNFSVHTASAGDQLRNYRNYTIPYFELSDVDWAELLLHQNIKARSAVLLSPTFEYRQVTKPSGKASELFNANHTFDDFMQINTLQVQNGKVSLAWNNSNALELNGLTITVFGDEIADYRHVKQRDIQSLFFKDGFLKAGGIEANLHDITVEANHQIKARSLNVLKSNGSLEGEMEGISIDNISADKDYGDLILQDVKWEKANVTVHLVPKLAAGTKKNSLVIRGISGNQTQFNLVKNDLQISAFLQDIDLDQLQKFEGGSFEFGNVKLIGNNLNVARQRLKVSAGTFNISSESQDFKNFKISNTDSSGTINFESPSISLVKSLSTYLSGDQHFADIQLTSPKIFYAVYGKPRAEESKGSNILKIDHLSLRDPDINLQLESPGSSTQVVLPRAASAHLDIKGFESSPSGVKFSGLTLDSKQFSVAANSRFYQIDKRCMIDLEMFELNRATSSWHSKVKEFRLEKQGGFELDKENSQINLGDLYGGDLVINSSSIRDVPALVRENAGARIRTEHFNFRSGKSTITLLNASFTGRERTLSMDSLKLTPILSQHDLVSSSPYQTDYITMASGRVKLQGFDLQKLVDNKSLVANEIALVDPSIYVFRDKEPPLLEGGRKPFLVEQIKNIDMPLAIDNVTIDNGKVIYIEKNKGNRLEGKVSLTQLKGHVTNVTNMRPGTDDSMSFDFTGKLLNKAGFNVQVTQSYSGPAYGFKMKLDLEPAGIVFLNPLVVPLSNVKFRSGNIDKLVMTASGDDNTATGEMEFFYHGLKIRLVRNGELDTSKVIKPVESALINAFLIRRENLDKKGLVYFRRLKDRSFFNYMNNIILSGIVTSVGIKSNKKYLKQIEKQKVIAEK